MTKEQAKEKITEKIKEIETQMNDAKKAEYKYRVKHNV